MSTENTNQSVQIIPATAPVVTRNGISKTLTEQVFGKMSKLAGHKFWAPVLDVSDIDDVNWAVAESLNGIVNKELRLIFADIYAMALEDNTDEITGKVNTTSFVARMQEDWADFTAGVAKLSDLEEQIGLLQDQIAPLVTNEHFGDMEQDGVTPTAEFKDLQEKVFALNKRIVPLRKQLAGIKEVYKLRAANRKAKESKSSTKTEAPANVK